MFYHRILEGPTRLDHNDQSVMYFTLLPANGEGLDEPNSPVLMTEHDLTDTQKLNITKLMSAIDIWFDDKTYEFRNALISRSKDDNGDDGEIEKIVLETSLGF